MALRFRFLVLKKVKSAIHPLPHTRTVRLLWLDSVNLIDRREKSLLLLWLPSTARMLLHSFNHTLIIWSPNNGGLASSDAQLDNITLSLYQAKYAAMLSASLSQYKKSVLFKRQLKDHFLFYGHLQKTLRLSPTTSSDWPCQGSFHHPAIKVVLIVIMCAFNISTHLYSCTALLSSSSNPLNSGSFPFSGCLPLLLHWTQRAEWKKALSSWLSFSIILLLASRKRSSTYVITRLKRVSGQMKKKE